MQMTMRWYGENDPVPLAYIRQVPGVTGVVSAVYDVAPGEIWPLASILRLKSLVEAAGLRLAVIESVPVCEEIKLGLPARDRLTANFCQTIRHLGQAGVHVVCYNFMPVIDWLRTDLRQPQPDGSTALAYDDTALAAINPLTSDLSLPGWDASYSRSELRHLMAQYQEMSTEQLWANLGYFLERVVPECEKAGVKLAIHPDDPPWSVFGLPRIITGEPSLARLCALVESECNGITLCTGSLGVHPANDIPGMILRFGRMGRIHFVHARNVLITGDKCFKETAHPSSYGSLDMRQIMQALRDIGFTGYIRPDHGRMIWGEQGRPGYGLFDRALGAAYLLGLWEATGQSRA